VKIDEEEKTFVKNLSTVMSVDKLSPIEEQFNDAFYHLERNASPKIECMNAAFSVIKIIRKK
jgi:DNA polymerase-3 subunit delta'